MKRWFALILMLMMMLSLAACSGRSQDGNTEEKKDMGYSNVEMTEKEKDLLCENFVDEDRIRNGQLNDAQKAALDELRAGTDLLDRKYPGLEYDILRLTPATKLTARGSLDVKIPGDDLNTYYVYTAYDDSGNISQSETVYGYVLREKYDAYVRGLLADRGIDTCCYTVFAAEAGDEIDADTRPEELIAMGEDNLRYTDIFVENTGDRDEAAASIEQVLSGEGISGIYRVFFVNGMSGKTAAELEKNRNSYEKSSFEVGAK